MSVRASRLVSIILLLQARGRMTAAQLAHELEVSVRTVYRDAESLHAAGIPLYGDAGPGGGYQLLDGYRTRLTGLSPDEAKALPLSGLPGPAAELGLGAVLAAAELKVRAALPPALAEQLDATADRFHLDPAGWYAQAQDAPFLPAVADAVWRGLVLQLRYRRWKEPTDVDRRLEPYGLVLKAGRWYLVAGPGPRTYRVDQILDLVATGERCVIPDGFSLAAYWLAYTADFLASLHRASAVVRLSPAAAARQRGPAADAVAATGVTEPDGWIRAIVSIESIELATAAFLAPDIEVLEPPELRASVAAAARAMAEIYRLQVVTAASQEGRFQLRGLAAFPCLSKADPFEPVVFFPIYHDVRAPGHLQREHRPIDICRQNGPRASLPSDLFPQLPDNAREEILARFARAARRSPRPVSLAVRAAMMSAMQQQIPPSLRRAAGNDDGCSMRPLTADGLAIPGGELPYTAEISHASSSWPTISQSTLGWRDAGRATPVCDHVAMRMSAGESSQS